MRFVDARNHRQGNGNQRPRLTAPGAASRTADLPPMREVGGPARHPSARRGRSLFGQIALLHGTAWCPVTPRHAGNLSPFVPGIAGGATDLTYILHTSYIHLTYILHTSYIHKASRRKRRDRPEQLYERQTAATRSTQRRSAGIDHPAGTTGIGFGSACAVYRGARGRDRAREQPPERDLCVRLRDPRRSHPACAGFWGVSVDRDPSFHASQGRRWIPNLGLPRPRGRPARLGARHRPLVIHARNTVPLLLGQARSRSADIAA